MKRVLKNEKSVILRNNIAYGNAKLKRALHFEQNHLCAYHEKYLGEKGGEVDHFDPTLKNTEEDNYNNWFLIDGQLNREKSQTWYQPILHPTAIDFEERLVYDSGYYRSAHPKDKATQNLIKLLKLNDEPLVRERIRYIKRKRKEINIFQQNAATYFKELLKEEPKRIEFIRVIQEEFGVTLNLKNNKM